MFSVDTNAGLITNYEVLQHLHRNTRYTTYSELCTLQNNIAQQLQQTKQSNQLSQLSNKKLQPLNLTPSTEYKSYTNNINNILTQSQQQHLQLQYKHNKLTRLHATCWVKEHVIQYLNKLPAATQSDTSIQNTLHKLQQYCQTHKITLTLHEYQDIINVQPNNIIQLQLIIDDLYERFNNNDQLIDEFLLIISSNLPTPPVFNDLDTGVDDVNTNDDVNDNMTDDMNVDQSTNVQDKLQTISQHDNLSSESSSHRMQETDAVTSSSSATATTTHIPKTNGINGIK